MSESGEEGGKIYDRVARRVTYVVLRTDFDSGLGEKVTSERNATISAFEEYIFSFFR